MKFYLLSAVTLAIFLQQANASPVLHQRDAGDADCSMSSVDPTSTVTTLAPTFTPHFHGFPPLLDEADTAEISDVGGTPQRRDDADINSHSVFNPSLIVPPRLPLPFATILSSPPCGSQGSNCPDSPVDNPIPTPTSVGPVIGDCGTDGSDCVVDRTPEKRDEDFKIPAPTIHDIIPVFTSFIGNFPAASPVATSAAAQKKRDEDFGLPPKIKPSLSPIITSVTGELPRITLGATPATLGAPVLTPPSPL